MNPGATMHPPTSTTSASPAVKPEPIAAILSPSISKSAVRRGAPLPSMIVPPRKSIAVDLSEERSDCTRDVIFIVDCQQHSPFVECRARMRNAAADQVADVDVGVVRNSQIGVLIVHRRDFPLGGRALRRCVAATAKVPLRDRQIEVERCIAFAHGQQSECGLRPRLDLGPYLERWLQARSRLPRTAAACLHALEHA